MASTACIFGGSGKLGERAIPLLQERDYQVRALVHRSPIDQPDVESVPGSIVDPEAVAEAVKGSRLVIQMATTKEDPQTFLDVSLKGTFHILEACRRFEVEQFLLLGGDAAFGIWFYPQPTPIHEEHPLTAYPGYYAFSKVMEETMTQQYRIQYGLPITILRSSWVFSGRDLLDHFSILKNVDPAEEGHGFGTVTPEVLDLVRSGQERIPILLDSSGNPLRRHIVHLDDVMQAFGLMLSQPAARNEDFNIAAPAAFDYRTAANYLAEKTGIPTVELPCPDYHSFEIDISKARKQLGYDPQNDIFRMIDRALDEAAS